MEVDTFLAHYYFKEIHELRKINACGKIMRIELPMREKFEKLKRRKDKSLKTSKKLKTIL